MYASKLDLNSLFNLLHQQQYHPFYYQQQQRQKQVKPRVIKKLETEDEFQIQIFKPYGNYQNYEVKIVKDDQFNTNQLIKIVISSIKDNFKVDFQFNFNYIDIDNINWQWFKSENILCLNIPKRIHYVHNNLNDILNCLIDHGHLVNGKIEEKHEEESLEDHEKLLEDAAQAIKTKDDNDNDSDNEKTVKEQVKQDKLAKEQAEAQKLQQQRIELEKQQQEKLRQVKLEQERLAKEKAQREELEKEKQRLAKEKAQREELEKEKQRLAEEKAQREELEKEKQRLAEKEYQDKLKQIEELKQQELAKIEESKRQLELLEQKLKRIEKPKSTESNQEKPIETKQEKPIETKQEKPAKVSKPKDSKVEKSVEAKPSESKPVEQVSKSNKVKSQNKSKSSKIDQSEFEEYLKQQQDFFNQFFNFNSIFEISPNGNILLNPISKPSHKDDSQESIESDDEPTTPKETTSDKNNLTKHPSLEEVEDEESIMYRKKFGH
ncbi:unnamed protein product [Candida verbasci]|uniref:Uncharacterized protein n=1 Tax=Candida verbasci TaxID=1227364 RepID=A0A9W4U027_9ASCO|nr:unnamed protein product [Candida verbasci]